MTTAKERIEIARQLYSLRGDTTNSGRDSIKSLARQAASALSAQVSAVFKDQASVTPSAALDKVGRNVLLDIAVTWILQPQSADAWSRVSVAAREPSRRKPSPRSPLGAWGHHENVQTEEHLFQKLKDFITSQPGEPMKNLDFNVNVCSAIYDVALSVNPDLGDDVESAVRKIALNMVDGKADADAIAAAVMLTPHENRKKFDECTPEVQDVARRLLREGPIFELTKGNTKSGDAIPTATLAWDVDSAVASAVNQLLPGATGGTFRSIEDIKTAINSLCGERDGLAKELTEAQELVERLKTAASTVTSVAKSGTVQVDASTLTYEVVMRSAGELFPAPDGAIAKELGFDIVTLVWKDDSGNVVQHPNCPDVDDAYQFRLRHLIKFLTANKFGQNIWLHGHTGTGKTTLAEQIAARTGFPIERLNLDSNLERADIVGGVEIVVEGGAPKTKYREGILPRAMQQPCMFVLDEIDAGRPDVLFVIQRALESKGLTLTEDGGRVVKPHELFRFVATANSRGQGDEYGWYQGVRQMNLAMLNRFGAFIEVNYLDRDDEVRLLSKAYPALGNAQVEEMAQFAHEIRQAFSNGEISQTMSPRNLHAMAMYFLHFKPLMGEKRALEEAVQTTVTDAAPADCTQRILEISSRVFR